MYRGSTYFMKTVREGLIILAMSVVSGAVAFLVHPKAPSFSAGDLELELDQVEELGPVFWVDARADEDFARGHLDGAISLNVERWEELLLGFLDSWTPDATVVIYCSSQACLSSHEVAERLQDELGFEEIYVLKGGWESLLEAGRASGGSG